MKMIVGLGNPGRKYLDTRHNIGFVVLDWLEKQFAPPGGARRTKFEAEQLEVNVNGQRVLLIWPQTFMNLSGAAVQPARDFFKIADEDILIVCDDFSLPLGKLRFRAKGSSGGQKGLADVMKRLGTQTVSRLRIGIGAPHEHVDPADFVLSRFRSDEKDAVDKLVQRASEAAAEWVRSGVEACMNRWNADESGSEK
jgi:PTH1 family peptidyl-tRNA hydrolase